MAFGLICESVCALALCLCVGLGVGRLTAQPVSDAIMARQDAEFTERSQPNYGDGVIMGTGGADGTAGVTENVEVALTPESILFIAVVSLMLCLVTNVFGIFTVMGYEPMKILSERI